MKPGRRHSLRGGVLVCALLVGCVEGPEEPRHHHFYAMGTQVTLSLRGDPARDERLLAAVEAAFAEGEARWDAWGQGELARFNALLSNTGEGPVEVPEALREGLSQAIELGQASGSRFHPALGDIVALWHFHRLPRPAGPPPGDNALTASLERMPALSELGIGENGLHFPPGRPPYFDLGGIAKGWAVARAGQALRNLGTEHALVNAGGDLIALGEAGGRPWRVGVLDPRATGVLASVSPADGECVFTSGDYERDFEHEGERYHHILDPTTGRPARGAASVTVVNRDCALADAAATALLVAGAGDWPGAGRGPGGGHAGI
jgi:thiamine biosynthesis lipoprotein